MSWRQDASWLDNLQGYMKIQPPLLNGGVNTHKTNSCTRISLSNINSMWQILLSQGSCQVLRGMATSRQGYPGFRFSFAFKRYGLYHQTWPLDLAGDLSGRGKTDRGFPQPWTQKAEVGGFKKVVYRKHDQGPLKSLERTDSLTQEDWRQPVEGRHEL